jgi:hypothetical protein
MNILMLDVLGVAVRTRDLFFDGPTVRVFENFLLQSLQKNSYSGMGGPIVERGTKKL